MYSDRYCYLNIYDDKFPVSGTDTRKLGAFISNIPELRQTDQYEFQNNKPFPFTRLLLLKAKSPDSWKETDTDPESTNLISIVCEKGEHVDIEELKRIFGQIAAFLNWKLVDEALT